MFRIDGINYVGNIELLKFSNSTESDGRLGNLNHKKSCSNCYLQQEFSHK